MQHDILQVYGSENSTFISCFQDNIQIHAFDWLFSCRKAFQFRGFGAMCVAGPKTVITHIYYR